jgi:hypothetical protein
MEQGMCQFGFSPKEIKYFGEDKVFYLFAEIFCAYILLLNSYHT